MFSCCYTNTSRSLNITTTKNKIKNSKWTGVNVVKRGNMVEICYRIKKGNHVHRINGPAYIRLVNGIVVKEMWYHGTGFQVKYRKNGPVETSYYDSGKIHGELWISDTVPHRHDGPAKIQYFENGHVKCEIWFFKGTRFRADGPAMTLYYPTGKIGGEWWYIGGKIGRTQDKPAITMYRENGMVESEEWYRDNNLSRRKKPALLCYDVCGKIEGSCWCRDGETLKATGKSKKNLASWYGFTEI